MLLAAPPYDHENTNVYPVSFCSLILRRRLLSWCISRIELTDEFKKKLAKCLKKPSRRISHKEVLEEFGQD